MNESGADLPAPSAGHGERNAGQPSGEAVVEAVIFDWGGTLTPWHNRDAGDAWLATVDDPELAARLHAAEIEAWARCRDEQTSSSLAAIFAAAQVEPTATMLAAHHAWWEPHTMLDPDVPDVFAGLRERGIRIGVLSNTLWAREVHEGFMRRDGVLDYLDGDVYTSEIPWTKPHPEAFRAALRSVGVADPARAVFVGDRLFDDIHGAKSVGMRAVLVPHSDIPAEQRGAVDGEPDAVIARLHDLLALVDGWHDGWL